jgi:hypothetical protein
VGDYVIAAYIDNDNSNMSWHRAIVTEITNNGQLYTVFYCDYGNSSKNLKRNQLKLYKGESKSFLAYKTHLNNIKLISDQNKQIQNDFFTKLDTNGNIKNYNFNVLIVSHSTATKSIEQPIYNVEIWTKDQKTCLNKLIDANYQYFNSLKVKPSTIQMMKTIQLPIDRTKVISHQNSTLMPILLRAKLMNINSLLEPFYFVSQDDIDLRDEIDRNLENFYSIQKGGIPLVLEKEPLAPIYCAVLYKNKWYRAVLNGRNCFHLDYGFSETLQTFDNLSNFKLLQPQFYGIERLAFPVRIVEKVENEVIPIEMAQFDEKLLMETLSAYFFSSTVHSLEVLTKLKETNGDVCLGVQIFDNKNQNLKSFLFKTSSQLDIFKDLIQKNAFQMSIVGLNENGNFEVKFLSFFLNLTKIDLYF